MNKSSIINEAIWAKTTAEEKIFSQLWQAIRSMNEKLGKLINITQNLENKLNGIQKRWLNMKIS